MKIETQVTHDGTYNATGKAQDYWECTVEIDDEAECLSIVTVRMNADTIICQMIEAPSDHSRVFEAKTYPWTARADVATNATICALRYIAWLEEDWDTRVFDTKKG